MQLHVCLFLFFKNFKSFSTQKKKIFFSKKSSSRKYASYKGWSTSPQGWKGLRQGRQARSPSGLRHCQRRWRRWWWQGVAPIRRHQDQPPLIQEGRVSLQGRQEEDVQAPQKGAVAALGDLHPQAAAHRPQHRPVAPRDGHRRRLRGGHVRATHNAGVADRPHEQARHRHGQGSADRRPPRAAARLRVALNVRRHSRRQPLHSSS